MELKNKFKRTEMTFPYYKEGASTGSLAIGPVLGYL